MDTQRTAEFIKFIDKAITPSVDELDKLSDANRKHVQKLVYTNLIDRFDYLVDKLLLANCREDILVSKVFNGNDKPVTESDLINLLLNSDSLESALEGRLQSKLRLSVLRQRHSRKLHTLLGLFDGVGDYANKPRVNPSKGDILVKFKVQAKSMPHSICGYADWLYSRRNTVVHGAGASSFLDNDRKQIKKIYGVQVSQSTKISTASIRTATNFYKQLCAKIETS